MTTRTIAAVTSGLSEPSSSRLLADRLSRAVEDALLPDGTTAEIRLFELRELAVDITHALITRVPSAALRDAHQTVAGADGLIAVTPVFTASYSGLFKSFVDGLDADSLIGTPVLLGATGGTERHSLVIDQHLRPLFAYMRALPSPTGVYAASSDWGAAGDHLTARVDRAAAEFAALVQGRTPPRPARDGDFTSVPFDQLLAGQ